MLRKRSKKLYFTGVFSIIVLVLPFSINIKVPNSINTCFEVCPGRQWILSKGKDGQIISTIIDGTSMSPDRFTVMQFERGESMNFKLVSSLFSKKRVMQGDTVGMVCSSRLQERFAELEGKLTVAKGNLTAKSTGEKEAMIDEAKKLVEYSDVCVQKEKLSFKRSEELHDKGFLSEAEYETAKWNLKQLELQREINSSKLNVLLTGSKNEELEIARSTVKAYRQEINLLKERMRECVIVAPITGERDAENSLDTILTVTNADVIILSATIKFIDRQRITEGQCVGVVMNGISDELPGQVLSISREVKSINGIQVLQCRIILRSQNQHVIPGLFTVGKIILDKITAREYVLLLFNS